MGSKSRSDGRARGPLSSRLPLPLALGLCLLCFLFGYLYGGKPLKAVPDLRTPSGGSGDAGAVDDVAQGIKSGEFSSARQLRELRSYELHKPGKTGNSHVSVIPYQQLSWHPRAYLFPGFADKARCEEIVALARARLTPSGLALREGESAENTKDIRTSSGTFLSARGNPDGALAWVERKMATATMTPVEHGEAFNILRYEIGQKYNSHYDSFNPSEYGPQSSQRIASFLLYLTDVDEGGETIFPYENYDNMDNTYDFRACIGLKVKPRQGDALLFWSLMHNGTIDPASLHGSCPVVKGEKWVATKWIRDRYEAGIR